MGEGFDWKWPPLPPFSSSLAGMLSSLSARERSCSALGFSGGSWGGARQSSEKTGERSRARFYIVYEGARWAGSKRGGRGMSWPRHWLRTVMWTP
jgi:hypothetical protein